MVSEVAFEGFYGIFYCYILAAFLADSISFKYKNISR